jgi:hypothetical protein
MGEVVTQAVTIEKWPEGKAAFDAPEDLFTCLVDLNTRGYRGLVQVYPVGEEGEYRWGLEVSSDDIAVAAAFGQCMVLMGDTVEVLTLEQYTTRFESSASRAAKKRGA